MKLALHICLLVCLAPSIVRSQSVILGWDFTGENNGSTSISDTIAAGLTSSTLSRGTGANSSTGSNSFRTTGFENDGIALSNTDYFQFTITPEAGYQVSLSSITAAFNGTSSFAASPGVTMAYAYSLDGINYTLLDTFTKTGTGSTPVSFDLESTSALQNVSSSITLRFFASGQTDSGGWGFFSSGEGTNGFAINGTAISAIPEPSTYAAIAGAVSLIGAIWWRRRTRKTALGARD